MGSERIYIFEKPSRSIPIWLEEIGDIEVKFTFSNRDELSMKFENLLIKSKMTLLNE